jgi:hypothetical protein
LGGGAQMSGSFEDVPLLHRMMAVLESFITTAARSFFPNPTKRRHRILDRHRNDSPPQLG